MNDSTNQRQTGSAQRGGGRFRPLVKASAGAILVAGLMAMATPAQASNAPGEVDLIKPTGGVERSFGTAYDAFGDSIALGDLTNDGFEEIVIANAGGSSEKGRVDVLDAFGGVISSFPTAYDDSGDALAVGDITNDGADEVVIANAGGSSENGRVDVLDALGHVISSFHTAYDDSGDKLAVGDVTGDGAEDIIIANNEGGGRMDVLDFFGVTIASFGHTGYDADDSVAVGDVNGDGVEEIVVANTEGNGRVDVFSRTGNVLSSFASGVPNPKVMIAEMTGDTAEEIAIVRAFRPDVVSVTQSVRVFDFFGDTIRNVGTTFNAGQPQRASDGIAIGQLNGSIVVANG